MSRVLFLFAYTCSGFAGLVYEVSWTRLLTLYIGHTTAAASTVVAAFLAGLATGAAVGGRIAPRLTPRAALLTYVALELAVGVAAFLLPLELDALRPVLKWSYNDAAPGLLFLIIRVMACLLMVFLPAAALGATFPVAIRWFATDAQNSARATGLLYALNTTGAAVGALFAGLFFIPTIGISGTTWVGIAASTIAALAVLALPRFQGSKVPGFGVPRFGVPKLEVSRLRGSRAGRARSNFRTSELRTSELRTSELRTSELRTSEPRNFGTALPAAILALSGFAALAHEIAWTRILTLVLGPTIYAFAATLAAVITGVALGSGIGAWIVGRTRMPAKWLAIALAAAALTTTYTSSLAGGAIPRIVARQLATSPNAFDQLLQQGLLLTAALIVPTAVCLGAAFPLALSIAGDASRYGMIYAVNTVGAVLGSLIAGFVLIPLLGLQQTLNVVSVCLIIASLIVVIWGLSSSGARIASVIATAAAGAMLVFSSPWDRELLASGVYLYAPYVPQDLDLETQLKAGTLLYYREGAAATVSVKRLTGTTTLAVDGKTDASNRGDMLTQKLVAHLPLLLHNNPREIAIIGLGSGVTVGSALRHPISRADVIEISPEVVEASSKFAKENHQALDDPRTNLIVGDGRSHLMLSSRQYDVIISEPSNPWIAGVAALFTREFFAAARDRLAPGGIICQWANAYNISDPDLRAIIATFRSVFPEGTAWLVGEDDVLMIASRDGSTESQLARLEQNWTRPGVAADLAEVSALEPVSLLSLFVGGPAELARYSQSAAVFTDDQMTLEFSSPRELHNRSAGGNGAKLAALLGPEGGPAIIRQARSSATAAQWRNRGLMMSKRDAHSVAYDDYVRALTLGPPSLVVEKRASVGETSAYDLQALDGLVRTAILTNRGADALSWIKSLTANRPPSPEVLVAISKLLASIGEMNDAIDSAKRATTLAPMSVVGFEQVASLSADNGDVAQLDSTVTTMKQLAPNGAATYYYAAVAALLRGQAEESVAFAQQAIAADAHFAPVYDLLGAAYTKLGRVNEARQAFERSLTFDAHDSTAYTNLGLLALAVGNRAAARKYFAEALWLEPESGTARAGMARTQ